MSRSMNRRDFVKNAAVSAVAAGLTGCAANHSQPATGSEPSQHRPMKTAASRDRVLGANDRIRVGVIGVGGMGGGHLRALVRNSTSFNCEVVAVCDIFSKRREYAANHAACTGYLDYRDVLERKDVDAVVIATPDHWHAPISIDAMHAGKDVYCEKPMTYTAEEAVDVAKTCDKTGAVMQIGSQYTSLDCYWRARQAIADRRIGKVIWAQSSFCRNSRDGEWNYFIDPEGNEQTIDWKRFLGARPKRPFDPARFFRWRKYWDYSGGIATDLMFHRLAPLVNAIGPSFPSRVTASGGIWQQKDGREVPDTFFLNIDYPAEHTVCLLSSMCNDHGLETCIHGLHGTLFINETSDSGADGGITLRAQGDWKEEFKAANGGQEKVDEASLPGPFKDWYLDHMANFMECVRTRNKPNCHAWLGAMVMVAVAAGVKAYRQQKVIAVNSRTGSIS